MPDNGVKTYDPSKVSVSWGGIPLSGFAEGSFIKVTPAEESWVKVVGSDGTVTRVRVKNDTAQVSVVLKQSSASNDYLSAVWKEDKKFGNRLEPFMLKDQMGTTKILAEQSWIVNCNSVECGKDLTNREWILDTGVVDLDIGGNG